MKKIIAVLMSLWALITTIIYTLVICPIIMAIAPFSKTGLLPFQLGKFWSWLIMKTNLVKIQAIGIEKIIANKSYVFISNHASNLDPPAVALAIPQTFRFIGKSSLAKIPFFGWAANLAKMIFIDRSNSKAAVEKLNKSIKDLKDGISAFFFAEGTRSLDGKLLPFKKGGIILALKAKLPIIPVTVIDSYKLLPKKAMHIKPGIIKVIVGDPIETTGYTENDKEFLLEKVRKSIQDTLKKYTDSLHHTVIAHTH